MKEELGAKIVSVGYQGFFHIWSVAKRVLKCSFRIILLHLSPFVGVVVVESFSHFYQEIHCILAYCDCSHRAQFIVLSLFTLFTLIEQR